MNREFITSKDIIDNDVKVKNIIIDCKELALFLISASFSIKQRYIDPDSIKQRYIDPDSIKL